ncbi:sensor histidine kinase [Paenibacillus sp. IB182496]|uniref:histidine kinase n=1 Tax=Paenibacillus sabuli TaxID=2772509 RepID=A0A927BYN4_9BACL|nr:histidine kinase [Paenibacillus sabuli]MBD2847733.1 sensor histidine kinase [Paenibacillus sabuli]
MTYRQIKWLIMTIPTLTIGIWEYVRHEFLLPYISMELGNWLAPLIVFGVSLLLLTRLFRLMEHNQQELDRARQIQTALQEREKLARELHDGIAQSLFLLNVQVERLEAGGANHEPLRRTVHQTHAYVREAIASLRLPAGQGPLATGMPGVHELVERLRAETGLACEVHWLLPDSGLSAKEKTELLALVREALINVHKHAGASLVRLEAEAWPGGWSCTIMDNGVGFDPEAEVKGHRYGLAMMRDRAKAMGWKLAIARSGGQTMVSIRKEAG